jgi:hypothetical protein
MDWVLVLSGGLNQALLSETVLKRVKLGTVRHDRQLSMSTSPTVTRRDPLVVCYHDDRNPCVTVPGISKDVYAHLIRG